MTTTIQAIPIPLSQLVLRDDVQSRCHEDEATIARYAEMMKPDETGYVAEFPEITVVQDGERYIVASGFHRTKAAIRVNPNGTIAAVAYPPYNGWTPVQSAQYHASIANTEEILHRTREDKINAAMMYLQSLDGIDKSDRAVAKFVRVDRNRHVPVAKHLLAAGYIRYTKEAEEAVCSKAEQGTRPAVPVEQHSGACAPPQGINETLTTVTQSSPLETAVVHAAQPPSPLDAKPVPMSPVAPIKVNMPLTGLAATLAQITAHEPAILALQASLETLLQQLQSPADCQTARPILDVFTVKLQALVPLHAQIYNVLNSNTTPS